MLSFVLACFSYFNNNFFDNHLAIPELQIDLTKKFSMRFDGITNQLVVGNGILDVKNKYDFSNHVLHEMIHIGNHINRIEDVNSNQYHTMKFASHALRIGLGVQKDKNQGWSLTKIIAQGKMRKDFKINHEANRRLNDLVENLDFDEKKYLKCLELLIEQAKLLKPSKLFFLKYECSCPPPHNSIRSGRRPDGNNPIDIICDHCKSKFICVSPLDD